MSSIDSKLNEAFQAIVNMSDEEKIEMAVENYGKLYPTFKKMDPDHYGMVIVIAILSTAAAADGELNKAEISLIQALLKGFHNSDLALEDVVEMIKNVDQDSYDLVSEIADNLVDEGQVAMAYLISAVCSIDDRLSSSEVDYIKSILMK